MSDPTGVVRTCVPVRRLQRAEKILRKLGRKLSPTNAVFLLLGNQNTPVGAELRGTTDRPWRGLAPGSHKDLGGFAIPACNCVSLPARSVA